MSAWLKSPKGFADGTKMTFAGLGKPEDRANIMAYMNAQGSNMPLPPPPAAAADPAAAAAEKADQSVPGAAETEPVLTEGQDRQAARRTSHGRRRPRHVGTRRPGQDQGGIGAPR